MFLYLLALRLASVWLVRTWFVPDEYWQSLEVAHRMVFGYGHLTWEWKQGVRSYIYPLFISIFYKLFQLLNIDYVYLLVIVPRIAQAVLSAYSDFCFYRWSGNRRWAVFSIATSWFWFYTGSRTLINTFETALTTIALSKFPWKNSKYSESSTFIWIVSLLCVIRPTGIIPWLPLCLYHLIFHKNKFQLIYTRYLPFGLLTLALSVALDSLCHGTFLVSSWEFLKANVLQGVGSHYGSNSWHWYVSLGFPAVLGAHLLPFLWAVIKMAKNYQSIPSTHVQLLSSIVFTLFIYSCLTHKEFRFILPLVPMALYIGSEALSKWSYKAESLYLWIVAAFLMISNAVPAIYLGYVHQRGTLDVMPHLHEIASNRPNDTSFLFLLPCHSTPFYSHIHVNVPARFLTCEPDFTNNINYKDEADVFFEKPSEWLYKEYSPNSTTPSHIISFDVIVPDIKSFLMRYKRKLTIHHTDFPDGRIGRNVIVHERLNF